MLSSSVHLSYFIARFLPMWRFIKEIVLSILINTLILYGVSYYQFGMSIEVVSWGLKTFLLLGAIFWGVNFVLKKIVHIIAFPLKLLTFGFFSLVINLGMLYFFERLINTYYRDMAIIDISQDYLKAFILSFVITLAYSLLSKLLK